MDPFLLFYGETYLKHMNVPSLQELDSPKKKGSLYIKKHYPEFYEYILRTYPYINKFCAGIYLYFAGMEHPKCPICGKPTPFLCESKGFQRCCSSKCANSDPDFRERVKCTCIERYGSKTPAESPIIKNKIIDSYTSKHGGMGNASVKVKEKQYDTMLNRYGTQHALQNDRLKDRAIMSLISRHGGVGTASATTHAKIRHTNQSRYGSNSYMGTDEFKEKSTRTNIDRYGTPIAAKNKQIGRKISSTKIRARIEANPDILNVEIIDGMSICTMKCPHNDCNRCTERCYKIPSGVLYDRRRDNDELCTKLLPVKRGRNSNTTPELFIMDILRECGIIVPENHQNFNILKHRGLDFVIPHHNLAIECNGIYWHSTRKKDDNKFHYKKYIDCAERGIQLLTIWQDWIIRKPEIVKSIIRSKLGCTKRIFARKCVIEQITPDCAREFYNTNHIQGYTNAKYHYGLFHKTSITGNLSKLELVAVMSFNRRKALQGAPNDNSWELVRYCSLLNITVVGGAGKLLNHFIKRENPTQISSFSSNDISNGALYQKLGFEKMGTNVPYWYIDSLYNRYHRSTFTKGSIRKRGWAPNHDNWTESEIMFEHKYLQIYDSGQTKWVLTIKSKGG